MTIPKSKNTDPHLENDDPQIGIMDPYLENEDPQN